MVQCCEPDVECINSFLNYFRIDSEIVSAAFAFMFTMLSKLLDYISRALAESPLSASLHMIKNGKGLKATSLSGNNVMQNGTEDVKLKQRKLQLLQRYRRRRRRKLLSNNEGSEDDADDDDDDDDDDEYDNDSNENDSNSDLSEGNCCKLLLTWCEH